MKTQRTRLIGLATLVAAACSPEPIAGPPRDERPRPNFDITGSCSATGVAVGGFIRNFACGDQIRFTTSGGTSGEVSALSSAASRWNAGVLGAHNLPRFNTASGNRTIQVSFSGTGDYYCGQVTSASQLNIGRYPSSPACSHPGRLSTGTLADLFLHELSHSIGFQSGVWHKPSTTTYTGHCATALYTAGRPLNEDLCQHEIEAIRAAYGLRSTAPNLSKHVMTGLSGLANVTIETNSSAVLTVSHLIFGRANGSLCGQANTTACTGSVSPANATLTWSSNSSVITLSGTGASRTVSSGGATGQATVTVNASSSLYEKAASFGDPGTGTKPVVTVYVVPPAGPPSNLTASNVTATSATVSWTNGDVSAGTTTIVQYRMTGQSPWITANGGLPAGQSSYNLTGLRCATSYDVNIYHQKNGVNSAWMTLTLFITGACEPSPTLNPPSGVVNSGCVPSTSGGKQYATYVLSWTAGANPSTSTFQIGAKSTNTPATADIIRTGPITTTTGNVGPYLVTGDSSPRYFWVRHVNGSQSSSWTALQGNPIQIKYGCLL